jgi:hypothetical protein
MYSKMNAITGSVKTFSNCEHFMESRWRHHKKLSERGQCHIHVLLKAAHGDKLASYSYQRFEELSLMATSSYRKSFCDGTSRCQNPIKIEIENK